MSFLNTTSIEMNDENNDDEQLAKFNIKKTKLQSNIDKKDSNPLLINSTSLSIVAKSKIKEDIIQSWEGVVTDVSETELTVRLKDLTNPENPNEELTLSKDEIDDGDLPLIQPGAMFYWYIGYSQGITQTKRRISIIRFRRIASWSKSEVEEAKKLGKEYANYFKGN